MSVVEKLKRRLNKFSRKWREETNLGTRLANIGHLLTGNFFGSILGLLAFTFTARALGPLEYGMLALCFSYTRAIERILSFQSWQPLIKYGAGSLTAGNSADFKSLMKFGLCLDLAASMLSYIVAISLALLASSLLGLTENTRSLVLTYCTILLFTFSGMPTAVLRLYGRFLYIAYGQFASSLIRLILCGTGALLHLGLWEFAFIWMGMRIFSLLFFAAAAFRVLHQNGMKGVLSASLHRMGERFPGIWGFAWSANLSLTIRSTAFEGDTLLVGLLADPASAGFYHVAKRFGRTIQQVGVQVQSVLYPDVARLWAEQAYAAFKRSILQVEVVLIVFAISVIVFFYFTIDSILRWTAGPAFLAATPLIIVQTIAAGLTLCGSALRSAMLAMGMQHRILLMVTVATAAFHCTALLLIPQIGAMGANIAHIVSAAVLTASMYWSYRKAFEQKTRT